MRDKCVHIRFRRGSEYCSCANSTASRASYVWARVAKMSRINSLRSSTFSPIDLFEIACLGGREIVVEDDHVGIGGRSEALEFFHFAAAKISGHIGRFPTSG